MTLNRRAFHQRMAASAVAVSTSSLIHPLLGNAVESTSPPTAQQPLPIIDTHQHLWNLKQFELPWLKEAPQVLQRSYLPADYAAATKGLNVVRAVYMEVDVAPRQQQAEADFVRELCKHRGTSPRQRTVAAVISGRPEQHDSFAKYISRFKDSPYIKGVRQVLHPDSTPAGLCLREGFVRSVQLLGKLGMRYDLCLRPTELSDGAKLAEKCPDTRFVLDHCGNADPVAFLAPAARKNSVAKHSAEVWKKGIHALARNKNVICKISGIVAGAPEDWDAELLAPPIQHCLNAFGPERVVFGGDWPVCLIRASYRQWVEALLSIIAERPDAEQRALLHDNAQRFYGLS